MHAFEKHGRSRSGFRSGETKESIWQQRVETGTSTTSDPLRTYLYLIRTDPPKHCRQEAQQSLKRRNGCNSGTAPTGRPRPRDTGCVDQPSTVNQRTIPALKYCQRPNGRRLVGPAQGFGRSSVGPGSVAAASVQSALRSPC
jgi:hypothetical protein